MCVRVIVLHNLITHFHRTNCDVYRIPYHLLSSWQSGLLDSSYGSLPIPFASLNDIRINYYTTAILFGRPIFGGFVRPRRFVMLRERGISVLVVLSF